MWMISSLLAYLPQISSLGILMSYTLLSVVIWWIFSKGSLTRGITFHRNSGLHLVAYFDTDWASDVSTCRLVTSGYMFLAVDIRWFCYLLRELGVPLFSSPLLLCNNQSTLQMATNYVFYARTHHIDIDLHFIGNWLPAALFLLVMFLPLLSLLISLLRVSLGRVFSLSIFNYNSVTCRFNCGGVLDNYICV
ncbi:hypothetical protein Pint_27311 [Pistacia integerrima]|uniref:Uncharacterized protein n=1 Tax=Pistacia integerrima TaxID=434235 RepID=A0ACC0YSA8_9ROSI|nr:hypothetical protein Pint_27311 [Pistacia integerrima]